MTRFINNGSFFKKYSDIKSKRKYTFRCLLRGISKNEGLKRLNNSVIYDSIVNVNIQFRLKLDKSYRIGVMN